MGLIDNFYQEHSSLGQDMVGPKAESRYSPAYTNTRMKFVFSAINMLLSLEIPINCVLNVDMFHLARKTNSNWSCR